MRAAMIVVILGRLGTCGGSPAGRPQGGLLLDVPLADVHRQPVRAPGQGGDVPDHDRVRRVRGTQLGAVGGESRYFWVSMPPNCCEVVLSARRLLRLDVRWSWHATASAICTGCRHSAAPPKNCTPPWVP